MGLQNSFILAAFVGLACCAVFLVMIKVGKGFRVRSAEKYWVDAAVAKGRKAS